MPYLKARRFASEFSYQYNVPKGQTIHLVSVKHNEHSHCLIKYTLYHMHTPHDRMTSKLVASMHYDWNITNNHIVQTKYNLWSLHVRMASRPQAQ